MERRLLILLIGLFLMIDLLAILFIYNHNLIDKDNKERHSEVTYSGNTITSAGSASTSKTSSSSSALSSFSGSYAGEYVDMGSCGCGK